MAYTPINWQTGDTITATKLNHIESGVQELSSSYTPTTWVNGDIITATKLNNIEQGIANAGGGSSDYLVLTEDSETGALDKTWQEINDATGNTTVIVLASTSSWVISGTSVDEGSYYVACYNNGQASQAGTFERYWAESPNDYPLLD